MLQNRPLLSVVIPTFERDEQLADCLELLTPGQQTLEESAYEIIVTDDGIKSTCEAMLRARFPAVRRTEGPHRGPAANRNAGARAARAAWVVFCDDDCLPSRDFLQAYADAIRDQPSIRVFEGCTLAVGPKTHPFESAPINDRGGLLWSCNLAIAADCFHSLKGFNEEFPYAAMEDMDFKRRLEDAGEKTLFVPQAKVVHPWRALNFKCHIQRHVASQLIYARLHPDEQGLFSVSMHLRNIARYYVREFPNELQQFGWLALRCQPARWWEMIYTGWHFFTKSSALLRSSQGR